MLILALALTSCASGLAEAEVLELIRANAGEGTTGAQGPAGDRGPQGIPGPKGKGRHWRRGYEGQVLHDG